MLGRLQDITGIGRQVPGAADDIVIIATLPAMAGLTLLIVWHNATTLQSSADTARNAADALSKSQQQLVASRARLVAATDRERHRLERDLHDSAQQTLLAVAVTIGLARHNSDPTATNTLLDEATGLLDTAIDEIRALAHGIYPPLLADGGLARALSAAAARTPVPVQVCLDGIGRYPTELETAVYFCCLEALQNTAKHAGHDATATIAAHRHDHILTVTITDTGRGFDPANTPAGNGLTNMSDRLAVIGGTLTITSTPGHGTTVSATIPTGPVGRRPDRHLAVPARFRGVYPITDLGACRLSQPAARADNQ